MRGCAPRIFALGGANFGKNKKTNNNYCWETCLWSRIYCGSAQRRGPSKGCKAEGFKLRSAKAQFKTIMA